MKIGIIGGGQLAQMLAQAGEKHNMQFAFLAPEEHACAADYGRHLQYPYDSQEAKDILNEWADVITYEFESIPVSLIKAFEAKKSVHPSSLALEITSDRLKEKTILNNLGIDTAIYSTVDSLEDLQRAITKTGLPAILKTRRDGYDGKGQVVIRNEEQLEEAIDKVKGVPCILESMVNFDREISIIAARNVKGDITVYPLAQNDHREGILRLSQSLIHDPMQDKAAELIKKVMDEINYVGVMAIELFDVQGTLIANEFSPRVHNSGHWSMDGASISQFENHLLAITNQTLAPVQLIANTAMVNLIGEMPDIEEIKKIPNTTIYDYGKEPRKGRKLGHINITAQGLSHQQFMENVRQVLAIVGEHSLSTQLAQNH